MQYCCLGILPDQVGITSTTLWAYKIWSSAHTFDSSTQKNQSNYVHFRHFPSLKIDFVFIGGSHEDSLLAETAPPGGRVTLTFSVLLPLS